MKQQLFTLQQYFFYTVIISFAATPAIGYWIAVFLGLVNSDTLLSQPVTSILLVCYLILVASCAWFFYRFLKPVINHLLKHPDETCISETHERHLQTFTDSYWAFFLIYSLMLPSIQHWLDAFPQHYTGYSSLLQFMLLQLVISILVGMPGYLYSLKLLGRLAEYTGVRSIHLSINTKMLLIGAYMPLLMTAILMRYYWWRTGFMSAETFLTWGLLGATSFTLAFIAMRTMSQGLQPIYNVINSSGASSYPSLFHRLKPRSTDEMGYMIQTLGNVFRWLDEQEAQTRAIVETAAEGIIVINNDNLVEAFNPAAETLFGYHSNEISGRPVTWLLPHFEIHQYKNSSLTETEVKGRHKTGRELPLSIRFSEMKMNKETFYTLMLADISERKSSERLLLDAEARYRNLVVTAHELVWSMDGQGRWTYLNDAAVRIYGYEPDDMLTHHYSEYQDTISQERDQDAFGSVLNGKELVNYETIHLDIHGNQRHISFNAKPIMDENHNIITVTGTARDITEQKMFEHELTYQAQHDSLTGLFNRNYFQQELHRVISRVTRSAASCALLYMDLDQFKYVNDTLGHAAGDKLLLECTQILKQHVREGDLLARFGGDEFTILLYNVDEDNALNTAESIRKLFEAYRFIENSQSFNITSSIGLTMIDNHCPSSDEALAQADLACNIAKSQGRNQIHCFNSAEREQDGMAEDMGWAARVRDAFEHNTFNLVYQPIVSIEDGNIHTYEVLLRMLTQEGNTILPGGFMPAAERFGLIHSVDRWTVSNAMQQLAMLHECDNKVRFAINLSGHSFEDKRLLPLISEILKNTNLDPSAVTFEITETAAIANLAAASQFITRLKDMGCQFALDDFGSGFCSFTYLKHLPVDELKIDGSFVQGMADTDVDQAMVQSMNQIAHALGKKTIAEFVENAATLALLRDYGVDYAQGHFCGKPQKNIQPAVSLAI